MREQYMCHTILIQKQTLILSYNTHIGKDIWQWIESLNS